MTPFWAARMMTGSASLSAAWARERSPVAIASSILTTAVRKRERRDFFTIVRRAIWRGAFRGELVLAIGGLCGRGDSVSGRLFVLLPQRGGGGPPPILPFFKGGLL